MKIFLKTLITASLLIWFTTHIGSDEASLVKIQLTPAKAVYATPFTITVSGVNPGAEILISAASVDRKNIRWEAKAVFKADKLGNINLAQTQPVKGDYNKADVYGLLWSMKPVNSKRKLTMYNYDKEKGLTINFTLTDSRGIKISSRLVRYYEDPDKPLHSIHLDQDGLKGTLYSPDNKKRYPGVILLSGSNGGSVNWLAKAISAHGFAVLDLPYFRYPGLPKALINIPLEYFYKAIKWVQKQKTVTKGKMGLIGGSRGGELVLQLASMFDEFKAVVAWVPAAHLWQGEDYLKLVPTWTWKGKALPFIGEELSKEELAKFSSGQMTSYREYFLNTLKNLDPLKIKNAVIKVEKIRAPLFLVSGKNDLTWPATEFSQMVIKRLKEHNFKYEYQHLAVENGGHLVFLPDFITSTYRHFNGGTREAELHGSIKSWNESIRFLHKYLGK